MCAGQLLHCAAELVAPWAQAWLACNLGREPSDEQVLI